MMVSGHSGRWEQPSIEVRKARLPEENTRLSPKARHRSHFSATISISDIRYVYTKTDRQKWLGFTFLLNFLSLRGLFARSATK